MTENLLIIMSDEHQHNAMSCAGHFVQTPHLDALAARGMRFINAYTPSPICVPARASLATGQHVHDLRLWDNAMPYHGQVRGWGHGLQDKGVPVESIGKLHYRSEADPAGFDAEHIPMMVVGGVGMAWGSIRGEHDRLNPSERMLGKYIGPGTSKYTDYDVSVTDRTKQWIEERAASGDARPWCLYVGLVAPHFPLVVPQEFYDMYPVDKLPPAKLHPNDGYVRHPWIGKQNYRDAENQFKDADERLAAFAAYWGLCSLLDHNVGDILGTLEDAGMGGNTTVAYTSDHGCNVGARGLWGKSNMYEEAAAIPMIVAGERVKPGTCDTTVSLIDLSEMVLDHFGAELDGERPGDSLYAVAEDRADANRAVLSQYHASGAVTGAFMIRRGRWKFIHYVGFEPELFDLQDDPEEITNLAQDTAHAAVVAALDGILRSICDPEAMDAQAHQDQADLVESLGGREAAFNLGSRGKTPPPELPAT